MVRSKPKSSSPPKTNYKAFYKWASDDLLNECTTLTTFEDLENHRGDPHLYNFNAFCRTNDAHISVRPDTSGEPVCVDDRPRGRAPFFFMYQTVFKRVGVHLPFTPFDLASPPVLRKPQVVTPLRLYFAITERAISAVLVQDQDQIQRLKYFVSKVLQGPKVRYQALEKAALAVVFSARRLRHYFQSFTVL